MRIKIEAEVEVPDDENLDAIDKNLITNREDVIAELQGAEFQIELGHMNYRFNIDDAEMR